MKKPENVVYNDSSKEYDAFKKKYPTSFNSKNFNIEEITDLKNVSKPYFKKKMHEIKNRYTNLIKELSWNQRIYNAEFNFNPIIGEKYYLYKMKEREFLSIIKPDEWSKNCIGIFVLNSNQIWKKIN